MTNPNDPAFTEGSKVIHIGASEPYVYSTTPLTKREYFAAMAMQGVAIWDSLMNKEYPLKAGNTQKVAEGCVALADALMAELNKKGAE